MTTTRAPAVDVWVSGEGLVRMTADEARRYHLAMASRFASAQDRALQVLASRTQS